MTATQPAPPAWTVRHDEQLCCYSVENDEELIADLFYAHDIPEDQEQQRIKAHTVAAAPALVEALAGLVELRTAEDCAALDGPVERWFTAGQIEDRWTTAREAIALAQGEAS